MYFNFIFNEFLFLTVCVHVCVCLYNGCAPSFKVGLLLPQLVSIVSHLYSSSVLCLPL